MEDIPNIGNKPGRGKWVILILALVLAGGTYAVWTTVNYLRPVRDFGVVQEGVLYRGGQPEGADLERLKNQRHIRTIVNLRGPCPSKDWYFTERAFCLKNGIEMIDLPVGDSLRTVPYMTEFLKIVTDPARQPVFVHCQHGKIRTGYVVAAYRIAIDHWKYEDAITEAEKFKFFNTERLSPYYFQVLRLLAAGQDWRNPEPIEKSARAAVKVPFVEACDCGGAGTTFPSSAPTSRP